jgi:hypothetical protein
VALQFPEAMDPDWFAFKGLGDVLGGTGASRLQNSLVQALGSKDLCCTAPSRSSEDGETKGLPPLPVFFCARYCAPDH